MAYNRVGILDVGTKRFAAGGTVTEMNILTLDASGDVIEAANGTTGQLIGTSIRGSAGAAAADIDVHMFGIAEVIAGAAINEGDPVTAGAGGKAAAAAPATTVNTWILGVALTAAAADGDVIFVRLGPYEMQGE